MYKRTLNLKNSWFKDKDMEKEALHLLVIGGTHGNESNAVKMVYKFVNRINENSTEGWWKNTYFNKVTVINALNTIGLQYNEREFIQEEKEETNDLNRYFDTRESLSKELLMKELEEELKKADVVVDVHNSPNILPCISIALNKNAPTYIDLSIRKGIQFVLTDDTPTIKRHADIDLEKVAFTYEFSGMGYNQKVDPNWYESYDVNEFEKFLNKIGDLWTFDKIFKTHWEYNKDKKVSKHTFWKVCNNTRLTYLPDIYEKKYLSLSTYKEGVYDWVRGIPLGHYNKGEQIAFIINPIDNRLEWEVKAPCDGTLIDVDESWWACKDGVLGEFQPDFEKEVYDYYEEENSKNYSNNDSKEKSV